MTIILASSPYISFVSNHINFSRKIILPLIPRICIQYVINKKSAAHVLPKHRVIFSPSVFQHQPRTDGSLPTSLKSGLKSPRSPKSPKSVPWILRTFSSKKTIALVLSGLKKQLDKLFFGCCWFLPCFVFVVFVCLWGRMKQTNDY